MDILFTIVVFFLGAAGGLGLWRLFGARSREKWRQWFERRELRQMVVKGQPAPLEVVYLDEPLGGVVGDGKVIAAPRKSDPDEPPPSKIVPHLTPLQAARAEYYERNNLTPAR